MTTGNNRIVLTGMGHFFPETVLDNDFFDQLDIGSSASWIEDRVGIRERRSILSRDDIRALRYGDTNHDELVRSGRVMSLAGMCHAPWKQALERAASTTKEGDRQVDLVIAGTSVPDWDIPANACHIAAELGLEAPAFDANSACSTFVVDLHVARSLMQTSGPRRTAVFTAERYTTRVDYSDKSNCVLFGDSAAAGLLESSSDAAGLELVDTVVESDPSGYEHVSMPDGGVFYQNGRAVQKFAVTKTAAAAEEIMKRNDLSPNDVDYFIGHQANLRMLTSACRRLSLPEDSHLFNVDNRGNQGAAGAPTVLSENWDRFEPGDTIVMSVVGAGLTWGAALFRKV